MKTYDLTNLPARLASRRGELGLTQRKLANRSGVRRSLISFYETGRRSPSISKLCDLALALETSTDWLLGCES